MLTTQFVLRSILAQLLDGESHIILRSLVLTQCQRVTDRDGRTDLVYQSRTLQCAVMVRDKNS